MFYKIKNWISEKKSRKWFKPVVIVIAFIIIAISVNVIDKKESSEADSSEISESSENENEESGFHIGIGHIVMLVIFVSAYGIDRAIVYKNKLEDDKKYDNNKEN